jgi:hypothetical protein
MALYHESGLQLDLPDGAHVRLGSTDSYRPLSGQHLKEMDFAWLHDDRLVLLELKDFSLTTDALSPTDFLPVKEQASPRRFDDLVAKITDTLMMLLAAWGATRWGQGLRAELPEPMRQPLKLVVAVAVNLPAHLKVHLTALRAALNDRVRARLKLADVASVALLDYDTLLQRPTFSPYVRRLPA